MDDREFCEAVARGADDPDAAYAACMRNAPRRGELHQEACPASCAYCGTRFGTACPTKCSACGAPAPAAAIGPEESACETLYSDFLADLETIESNGVASFDLSQYPRSRRKAIEAAFGDVLDLLVKHLEEPQAKSFNLRHCGETPESHALRMVGIPGASSFL
ncbi:MAG: hypothetical protein KGJ23_08260 [Euryarchaeota archaeon]|nr:hypothetical protein [Euryarchaeota archaeon]MDE1836595.1 hypothetical protein [Euryarchaeota archaeon]MDE1879210.1 hypothetical protein [Euryarchaeota archaeon]MDE2044565.1 hypothetical protein [Thermoplasmata archaeon]